jgi:signal transduction histidine kinase
MANTIIHDIKNPMATLRLYAQIIQRKTRDLDASRYADEMIRQVDRFVAMTQEILDFSRGVSELKYETLLLQEVMDTALRLIEVDYEKRNITVVRDFRYTGPCRLDGDKMARVFFNLSDNAADAMPDGGSLTVSTEEKDGTVIITFADTGKGIPEEVRGRVLEPFFTHGKKHGTGLGLSIVKKIMNDHGGDVAIDSEMGKGTRVILTLPFTTS